MTTEQMLFALQTALTKLETGNPPARGHGLTILREVIAALGGDDIASSIVQQLSAKDPDIFTKRERVAAMALQGLLANGHLSECFRNTDATLLEIMEMTVQSAINHADRLLIELQKSEAA